MVARYPNKGEAQRKQEVVVARAFEEIRARDSQDGSHIGHAPKQVGTREADTRWLANAARYASSNEGSSARTDFSGAACATAHAWIPSLRCAVYAD